MAGGGAIEPFLRKPQGRNPPASRKLTSGNKKNAVPTENPKSSSTVVRGQPLPLRTSHSLRAQRSHCVRARTAPPPPARSCGPRQAHSASCCWCIHERQSTMALCTSYALLFAFLVGRCALGAVDDVDGDSTVETYSNQRRAHADAHRDLDQGMTSSTVPFHVHTHDNIVADAMHPDKIERCRQPARHWRRRCGDTNGRVEWRSQSGNRWRASSRGH